MTTTAYSWKRYWVPREGGFSFDSQGFLLPPARDAEWAKYWKTDVVGFDELLPKPCLVLLGEPGIGKSFAIRDAEKRTRAARIGAGVTNLFRDLSSYSSDSLLVEDVFKSAEFLAWQRNGGAFHVFLDSFDECLLRVDAVAELLAAQFARISSVQNLFVRIASRTAEWRASLEDSLRQKWGKDSVGVFELAPLTREQVSEAASVHLQDAERFVEEVIASEVVSFAIKPLTLDLLIRVWKKLGGSLPPTQREIYEQGCLELCTDPESRQTPKLRRQHSPEQRLAVVSHVAAATFFCNQAAIWTGASRAQKPESDISVSELAVGSVTAKGQRMEVSESAVREALDTGLFTSRGPNRLGWAHQTYGEFLAARYLTQEGLSARQILELLTHPNDRDRKLIPQLQETAAWSAAPGSELFSHLARVQPDVLLRSDVATADERDKADLVEALTAAFADNSVLGDWWGMRKRYRKLRHAGLGRQLRALLANRKLAARARAEAILIAEACDLVELLPVLVKLALDGREIQSVRQCAAAVVARSANTKLKKRLRPLALGKAGSDPDDELRGAGLSACWPDHLSADELFSSLKAPKQGSYLAYHSFLSNKLVDALTPAALPRALAWVEAQPERDDFYYGDSAELVSRILDHAAEHIEDDGILRPLAKALLSRLRRHDYFQSISTSRLVGILEARPARRLALAGAMMPLLKDTRRDASMLVQGGLRLLLPNDLPWLIERLHSAKSPEMEKRFAHVIWWVFRPVDAGRNNAVIEASERSPALSEIMSALLKPMAIDSEETRKARYSHLEEERHRTEAKRRRERKLLMPPPADRLVALLDQFEAGDTSAWWKLYIWLELEDDGRWCQGHHRMDIRELAGWKKATGETKTRLVAAAERYVICSGASPKEWFSRRNIRHYPTVAGFRALLLLANENPTSLETLLRDVWRRWMPAILRLAHYDERDEHRLLTTKAFERNPEAAVEWAVKVVNEENKEGENLWVLYKLPEKWDGALGAALLHRIRLGRLKPQCFNQLLSAVVEHRVPEALTFARSQVPRKVPNHAKHLQSALHAARLLMIHGERGDWPRIWDLISKDAAVGKALLEGFDHGQARSQTAIFKILTEGDVSALWEWMLAQYPVAEDPDRRRGGEVTTRYAMADMRDMLVSYLADIGTAAGCLELQRLMAKYPEFTWFRRILLRGQEQMRRLTWQPVSSNQLFQLASNRHARLVQSGDQLLEAIMDSLKVLQEHLQGETPWAQFLWDGNKPKPEEAISEWVKVHLESDLKQRGVVLNREVQIHRFDRTDIHVTAVTQSSRNQSFDNVKVIIEVKGSWHRELKTAMETQLVGRYLKDNDCRHGLYFVGWFSADKPKRLALQTHLAKQSRLLSKDGLTINAVVSDVSLRRPAIKRRLTHRKSESKPRRPRTAKRKHRVR